MTEKRFIITGDRSISDHQKKRLYDLNDFDGMISVTECLNVLAEENQRLKAFIKRLTNNCGEIILMNGMGYKVDKILGDLE